MQAGPGTPRSILAAALLSALTLNAVAQADWPSHAPMRPLPGPSQRPTDEGPARFVDATKGDDTNAGIHPAVSQRRRTQRYAEVGVAGPAAELRTLPRRHAVAWPQSHPPRHPVAAKLAT